MLSFSVTITLSVIAKSHKIKQVTAYLHMQSFSKTEIQLACYCMYTIIWRLY